MVLYVRRGAGPLPVGLTIGGMAESTGNECKEASVTAGIHGCELVTSHSYYDAWR